MPSSKDKQVSRPVINAFKLAIQKNPAFGNLPRGFKTRFADAVLPHIDAQFGHDQKQLRRYVHNTVRMASDDGALQKALDTPPEASADKRLFKNYGAVIHNLHAVAQAELNAKRALEM